MILNDSLKLIKKKILHFYLNSKLYNKKITPSSIELIEYQPSPNLLDCLIKYDKKNFNFDIEIDGGINFDNNKLAIEAGANILVSGTAIFKNNNGDIKKNIGLLKSSQNNDFKQFT